MNLPDGRMRFIQIFVVLALIVTSLAITSAQGQAAPSRVPIQEAPSGCSSRDARCARVNLHAPNQPGRKTPVPHYLRTSCAPQVASTPEPTTTPMPGASPTPASTTAGSLVPDQAQLRCTGALSARAAPTQTFRVGVNGLLVRVDIVLCSPTKGAHINVTVSRTGSASRSSTASLKIAHGYSDCAWYQFDFHHPLKAARGDLLRLSVTLPNNASALWGFNGAGGDTYPRGVGTWRGHAINDFAFQTYMQRV